MGCGDVVHGCAVNLDGEESRRAADGCSAILVFLRSSTNHDVGQARATHAQPTYRLHGLYVRSELVLDAPITREPACDLEIRWGKRRMIPDVIPDGELLARVDWPEGGSCLTVGPSGWLWRVTGICDFTLDRTGRTARVHLAPDAEEELASLFVGNFLARFLALNGFCVLHASAIEVGAGVIAFIGDSGSGKTTVAALCCIAGAQVVTDDVLRVELRDDEAWCFGGSRALRLRPGADTLAKHLAAAGRRSTVDERTSVSPAAANGASFPIAAIVAPVCVRESNDVRVERLRGSSALLELIRFPRSSGWIGADRARNDLGVLAGLATSVPIYRAELPWGPRVDPGLGRRLLAAIGLDAEAPARESCRAPGDTDRGALAC